MKKRIFSLLLCGVMLLSLLPQTMLFTSAATGSCGDSLQWSYSSGTLTITGSGPMDDFARDNAPWVSCRESVNTVILPDGLTSIGNCAFYSFTRLTKITIPSTVTSIGSSAFAGCTLQ
ncbi:MAG: leucine-rich repeat domain-containing protein [Faecousia sp.]